LLERLSKGGHTGLTHAHHSHSAVNENYLKRKLELLGSDEQKRKRKRLEYDKSNELVGGCDRGHTRLQHVLNRGEGWPDGGGTNSENPS